MFKGFKQNACYDDNNLYTLMRYSMPRASDEDIEEKLKGVRRSEDYDILGYYEEDELVGIVVYRSERDGIAIDMLGVLEGFRGKGLATALIGEALSASKARLVRAKADAASVGFFRKAGFSVLGSEKNYYEEESFFCEKRA